MAGNALAPPSSGRLPRDERKALMHARVFDVICRNPVDGFIRRRSLLTLGGAAAAAIVGDQSLSLARKRNKKPKAEKTCKRQVDACRTTWTDRCATDLECEPDNLERILDCCSPLSTCKAGAALDCLFSEIS
jgi:hypothetical protein